MARRTAKGSSSPAWLRGYPRGALAVALLACFIGLTGPSAARSESAMLDLSRAVVVMPEALTGPERKAVELLVEDVARRSGIRWKVLSRWPAEPVPVVAIGSSSAARAFPGPIAEFFGAGTRPRPAEGYRIRTEAKGPAVLGAGNDARGVLFGVGRLLRELRTTQGRVLLPSGFRSRPPQGIHSAATSLATGPDQLLRRLGPSPLGTFAAIAAPGSARPPLAPLTG